MSRPVSARIEQAAELKLNAWQRFIGPALAGPLAILVTIPLLVLGVGIGVTWTAWTTQRSALRTLAEDGFESGAAQVAAELRTAMGQGEAVLAALRHHLDLHRGVVEPEAFALALRDQFAGRPVVAYLGYGSEGGDFHGIVRDESRGGLISTRRERALPSDPHCHLREYRFAGSRLELLREDAAFGYDPRVRPWYLSAVQADARVTTDPYAWYDSGVIGVTLAEPYRDPSGRRVGVIEVEFNVNTLSGTAAELGRRHGATVLIHTAREEILALPGLHQEAGVDQAGRGRVPIAAELVDPALRAYFAAIRRLGESPGAEPTAPFTLEVDGETHLAAVHALDLPGGKRWLAACIGSLDTRLSAAREHALRAAVAVAFALLMATGLALLFARHIVRTHLRAERAERAAAEASDAVRSIGAYHLYRKLGEGGMGEVWLAEHGLLARPVAVKLVHSRVFDGRKPEERELSLARFEREARTLAQLRSPHTITLYDFGISDDGDLFYAMELLDGLDLYQLMDAYGPQPYARVIEILVQAARSLGEAHERGLVHRDIKPANIYLCRLAGDLDVVKVLDFGMVRRVEAGSQRLTLQGTIEGTPAYMSPEQVQDSDEVDGRADIYALALVGYYLISGREVFLRDLTVNTLVAHLNDPPPTLAAVSEQVVPDELEHLLIRCLAKDPNDRPPSMAVLIEALEAIPIPPADRWSERQCDAWWDGVPQPDHEIGSERGSGRNLHRRPTWKDL
jgi:serine/threonine protein kinase